VILRLNGIDIKKPKPGGFSIERYKITKAGRLASGMMVMDWIAKKKKFVIQYDVLKGEELQTILDIIDSEDVFFTITYEENGVVKTKTVYSGPITYDLYRSDDHGWYWKNVTFNLIEQ